MYRVIKKQCIGIGSIFKINHSNSSLYDMGYRAADTHLSNKTIPAVRLTSDVKINVDFGIISR